MEEMRLSSNQESTVPIQVIAGVPLAAMKPETAADYLCAEAMNSDRNYGIPVHLVNAYTIALANGARPEYAGLFHSESVNFPDGKPLSWIGKVLNPAFRQVRGPQLFVDVMQTSRHQGIRHFLLGSTDEVLLQLKERLESRFPGIRIVGHWSPPFREMSPMEVREQDDLISRSGADIVWVGLGTPKQDYETERLARSLPVIAVAVGAAFDFVAGSKREAPSWITKLGFEWLYRLLSEPRRLWKRYVFGNFGFLCAVVKGIIRKRPIPNRHQ